MKRALITSAAFSIAAAALGYGIVAFTLADANPLHWDAVDRGTLAALWLVVVVVAFGPIVLFREDW